MASLTPNILPFASLATSMQDPHTQILAAGISVLTLVGIIFAYTFKTHNNQNKQLDGDSKQVAGSQQAVSAHEPRAWESLIRFVYACFLKPHAKGDGQGQQAALESFYRAQADVYDATRRTLLRGREDMLGLAAAQLVRKAALERGHGERRVWVDVGGGTGYNIEAMSKYISVPDFFSSVYLVDFSPSLCEVARRRFARLGWDNVKVVCQDARVFKLEDHENLNGVMVALGSPGRYSSGEKMVGGGADLITMSYSLSMIPDFYSVVDSLTDLLAPSGFIGVIDFYVQSSVDLSFRNYTGGNLTRHVNWLGRIFWRAWFDVDRVGLEAGRRDYLEYRFGTVLSADSRNYTLGAIPYYMWIGRQKKPTSSSAGPSYPEEFVQRLDAAVTESPYLHAMNHVTALSRNVEVSIPEIRSKAYDAAVVNLSTNLPLPSFFYQNHHWRIHYDDQLKKHTQFKNEYIYAFTWEDSRVDDRLLKLGPSDVVLAITSAGDNILSYALSSPARIHAVDLNPNQNHLLELKVAAYTALPYADFWKLFGEGKHPQFRSLLIERLSPHLSSRAFQYWLEHAKVFTRTSGKGLYGTGGSRHALRVFSVLTTMLGLRNEVTKLLDAKTLNEQREIYDTAIRPVMLSRILSYLVISQESFLWAALGVPKNQLAMFEADYAASLSRSGSAHETWSTSEPEVKVKKSQRGAAVWQYMLDTLDPVVHNTLIGTDNPYYLVCTLGHYTPRCHPAYLSPKAHGKLSRPDAFDGLRIHTDEIEEVVRRLKPGSLTVAVIMDSMDWFDPADRGAGGAVKRQITALIRALEMGGRVLLRSAGLTPWYIKEFEGLGFSAKRVGVRTGGACIDRVNMYASCWILTKVDNLPPPTPDSEMALTPRGEPPVADPTRGMAELEI